MKHSFSTFKKYINVSCETLEKLVIYSELLCFWQKKMNLVSNNSMQDAEIRHFLDSAQLYLFCKNLNGNILILDLLNLNFRKVKLKKLKNV